MDPTPQPGELSPMQQAMLLGALVDGRTAEDGPLRCVHGEDARVCSALLARLQAVPPPQRHQTVLSLSRAVASSLPTHIERVHPGWIAEALAHQPEPVLRAVLVTLPPPLLRALGRSPATFDHGQPRPWVSRTLCRQLLGDLEPMPPEADPTQPLLTDLPALPLARLQQLALCCGLVWLAALLHRVGERALTEQMAGAMPGALRDALLQALQLPLPAVSRAHQQLQPVASAGASAVHQRLQTLALSLLASALRPRARRQLAQRLPPRRGAPLLTPHADGAPQPGAAARVLRLALELPSPTMELCRW